MRQSNLFSEKEQSRFCSNFFSEKEQSSFWSTTFHGQKIHQAPYVWFGCEGWGCEIRRQRSKTWNVSTIESSQSTEFLLRNFQGSYTPTGAGY